MVVKMVVSATAAATAKHAPLGSTATTLVAPMAHGRPTGAHQVGAGRVVGHQRRLLRTPGRDRAAMTTTATETDQSDQEWFQYLRDTLPKLAERDRQVVVALIKASYDGTLSVEQYDEGRPGLPRGAPGGAGRGQQGGRAMTTPCRLRDHLPLAIGEPKEGLAWKLEKATDGLHHLATRLDDSNRRGPCRRGCRGVPGPASVEGARGHHPGATSPALHDHWTVAGSLTATKSRAPPRGMRLGRAVECS